MTTRWALGLSYDGSRYLGWQRQSDHQGPTVQGTLEKALGRLANHASCPCPSVVAAGRTDTGVHALMQVVHWDAPCDRPSFSWVRGINAFLPSDVAIQWASPVSPDFHARHQAKRRRYVYVLLESPVRPALETHRVGWVFTPLNPIRMEQAAQQLIGEHDFSAFRSIQCQAKNPVRHLHRLDIARHGPYWSFVFEANAFLHHMVRNLMGALIYIGQDRRPLSWLGEVLQARNRALAAPTFSAAGLYFIGPVYDAHWGLPTRTAAFDWLPCPLVLSDSLTVHDASSFC
jgi:tRNA pseudouridine38-40 synthase